MVVLPHFTPQILHVTNKIRNLLAQLAENVDPQDVMYD